MQNSVKSATYRVRGVLTPDFKNCLLNLRWVREDRIKNFKCKGYDNCSTEPKLILTHFDENLNFCLIKLAFIETIYHILNRNQPQGTEAWPPGSHDIHPFDYLKCGVSRRGINRSSHKKQSLIATIMEVFSNIPREATKRGCWWFWPRLEEVIGTKDNFMWLKQSQ